MLTLLLIHYKTVFGIHNLYSHVHVCLALCLHLLAVVYPSALTDVSECGVIQSVRFSSFFLSVLDTKRHFVRVEQVTDLLIFF